MSSLLKRKHVLAASKGAGMTYQQRIVADGAVAYWPLDEISGTTARDLVGLRNGTISGGVVLNQLGAKAGIKAMAFNGTTARIDVPAIPSISPQHTFEGWGLFNSAITSEFGTLLTRPGFGVGSFIFLTTFATGNSHRLATQYPGNINTSSDPTFVANNVWHHYVTTYDGSNVRLYIDGNLTATFAGSITDSSSSNPIVLGLNTDFPAEPITIHDVAFYTRTLTPTEITAHRNARLV